MEIFKNGLDVKLITNSWYEELKMKNFGAIITFVGVVRDEDRIDGLSFDIYVPLLKSWFASWEEKAKYKGAIVLMAHSIGDVLNHETSYIAGVCSPKRRVALDLIDEFVEDFKANAPIWKYDIVGGKRVYAKDRSTKLEGAGILL